MYDSLTSEGTKFDMLWCTDIERLTFRTARAWNKAEYNGEFINADGEDMDGQDRERKPELFGNFDVSYDGNVSDNWRMYLLSDTRFGDEYAISAAINPYVQDGYWLFDTANWVWDEVVCFLSRRRHTTSGRIL